MGWWGWGPVLAWTARTRGWRTFVVGLQKIFITIIEQVEENHAVGRHISLLSLNNTAKNIIWLKFLNIHPWKWPRFSEFKRDNGKEGLKVRSKRPKNVPSVVDLVSLKIFQPILPIKIKKYQIFFYSVWQITMSCRFLREVSKYKFLLTSHIVWPFFQPGPKHLLS